MDRHEAHQVLTRSQLGVDLLVDIALHQLTEQLGHFAECQGALGLDLADAVEGMVEPTGGTVEGICRGARAGMPGGQSLPATALAQHQAQQLVVGHTVHQGPPAGFACHLPGHQPQSFLP